MTNGEMRDGSPKEEPTGESFFPDKLLKLDGQVRRLHDRVSSYENLKAWILRLPRVSEVPHKLGGTAFQADGVEFMHSHGPSWLDIRLSKEDQASVLRKGLAFPHRADVHARDGWVGYQMENSQDLAKAKRVIQLAYKNAKKNPRVF